MGPGRGFDARCRRRRSRQRPTRVASARPRCLCRPDAASTQKADATQQWPTLFVSCLFASPSASASPLPRGTSESDLRSRSTGVLSTRPRTGATAPIVAFKNAHAWFSRLGLTVASGPTHYHEGGRTCLDLIASLTPISNHILVAADRTYTDHDCIVATVTERVGDERGTTSITMEVSGGNGDGALSANAAAAFGVGPRLWTLVPMRQVLRAPHVALPWPGQRLRSLPSKTRKRAP